MQLSQLSSANGATIVRLTIPGRAPVDVPPADAMDRAGALYRETGTFPAFAYYAPAPGALAAEVTPAAPEAPPAPPSAPVAASAPAADDAPTSDREPSAAPPTGAALGFSDFGAGNQILDAAARTRMERIYDRLEKAGVTGIERTKTFAGYAPGTRMAAIGYANQEARRQEFLAMAPAESTIAALTKRIVAEKRSDVAMFTHEFADKIQANGKIRILDLRLGEQAIRGLMTRIKSPALSYLLGLRERIAVEYNRVNDDGKRCGDDKAIHADVATMAEILRHECKRVPAMDLKLRTRAHTKPGSNYGGDVYAVTSPRYANADAPEVMAEILPQLPRDARATFSYDPKSTAWTIRLNTWTSTRVADQAVGEPFQAYASIGSRDNGSGSLEGGGGIVILACLNAGTYVANGTEVTRRHLGRILVDVAALMKAATASIDTLTEAWGAAREAEIAIPAKLTIQDAIPGFWRHLLTDRRSELVTVLPGRTETHVENLTLAYHAERRDESRIVRADLAQGWTRYAQAFPADVQRDAEKAIGAWTVNGRPVGCAVKVKEG